MRFNVSIYSILGTCLTTGFHPRSQVLLTISHDDLVPRSSPPTARWAAPPVSAMSASSVWPVATTFAAWIFRGVGGRRFLGPFKSGRCLVNHGTPNSGSIEKQ